MAGPTLPFLLTHRAAGNQFLDGIFSNQPERVGWLLLGYSLIFGIGHRVELCVASHIGATRTAHCARGDGGRLPGLFLLNHSGGESPAVRWAIGS